MDVVLSGTRVSVPPVLGFFRSLVTHDSIDRRDTWNTVLITDTLRQQPVPDLPGEHGGVLLLVLADGIHNVGGCHLGFASPYHSRLEVARLVISTENL